ncbi:MAG TPA: class I SAM-dependent methyltransferase [Bryobacteraceae bacterium]|nr:class I SAM-dependent methyltransferase [Bryobacteraceae bacterium]
MTWATEPGARNVLPPPSRKACIFCGGAGTPFFEIPAIPIDVSALFRDADEARGAPMGRLALVFCERCGGIFNSAWDPAALSYDTRYENSLDASAVFGQYAEQLARRLTSTYATGNGSVVEIGCGQGRFLQEICRLSGSRGAGFDPSYHGPPRDGSVSVERRLFKAADAEGARLIICRHVLEHLEDPSLLITELAGIRQDGPDTVVYFEVPNAAIILDGALPWDLIYPHVSYFTLESLTGLFRRSGFHILDAGPAYSGQFLYVEATAASDAADDSEPPDTDAVQRLVASFPAMHRSIVDRWARYLEDTRRAGNRIAFWGAGAKGVTFLNLVPGARAIDCVIDLNPRKRDSFVPGTGQRVSDPEALKLIRPKVVVTLNPIYVPEIRERLSEMGIRATIVTEPSDAPRLQ